MANSLYKSNLDDLPPQFVASLRVLFDILDEEKTGYVKVGDIESRWENNGVSGLPSGVPEALRKVTPPSGKLSFERFVAGLKIALLRKNDLRSTNLNRRSDSVPDLRDAAKTTKPGRGDSFAPGHKHVPSFDDSKRPTPAPFPDRHHSTATKPKVPSQTQTQVPAPRPSSASGPNMATVRPNNAIAQRSQTRGALYPVSEIQDFRGSRPNQQPQPARPSTAEPLRPLQPVHNPADAHSQSMFVGRGPGDGRSSVASASALDSYGDAVSRKKTEHGGSNWKLTAKAKRADPRRHTVSNGIDFNMIKRMKQLEQEKDLLLQGLEAVDRARDWYQQQIQALHEKQKYVGRGTSPNEYSLDSYQERLNIQTSRILQLNQQVRALVDSSDKDLPVHMNLEVSSTPPRHKMASGRPLSAHRSPQDRDTLVAKLQSQNHCLAKEVDQRDNQIEQLEQEKAQIIKELFACRGEVGTNGYEYDDTTFI